MRSSRVFACCRCCPGAKAHAPDAHEFPCPTHQTWKAKK